MAAEKLLAIGRRKTSTARVHLLEGKGIIKVNNKEAVEYFKKEILVNQIHEPLKATDLLEKFDVRVNVNGGGVSGQIGAIKLGIARAILKYDASLKPNLKKLGLLTRDSRMVERKKPGRPKARKRFQFSKR
ncbi:MAG: 30S ribosomal protein S9 [Ignavibacteria bacterium]